MPKKTRKMKQRAALRRSALAAPVEEPIEAAVAPAADPTASWRPTVSSVRAVTPLTFDYTHIYSDLKRIALFASFFFAVLIVLSFIIK